MLKNLATWQIKDVLWIYFMRIMSAVVFGRMVYPQLFTEYSFILEVTDRVITILLVLLILHQAKVNLPAIGLAWQGWPKNMVLGLLAGGVLLVISLINENMMTAYLPLYATRHPLLQQIDAAKQWTDFLQPIFLAGMAAPAAEELLYRVATYLPLKKRLGLIGGGLLAAVIFALFHFNAYWFTETVLVGLGLTIVYEWTGSLVSAIIAHSFINTAKIIMAIVYTGIITI